MKVKCPNCPNVVLMFDSLPTEMEVTTLRCPNCGCYASKFKDEHGVTYHSHSIATIQRMRDESKEARAKLKPLGKIGNRRSRTRKSIPPITDDFQI